MKGKKRTKNLIRIGFFTTLMLVLVSITLVLGAVQVEQPIDTNTLNGPGGNVTVAAIGIQQPDIDITRGGVVNEGVDPVDGEFTIPFNDVRLATETFTMGLTKNPQDMTGGFCDRPFRFSDVVIPILDFDPKPLIPPIPPMPPTKISRGIGVKVVAGDDFHGASFFSLSPNGEIYPSDNDQIVDHNYGIRYYGRTIKNPTGYVNLVFDTIFKNLPTGWEMSLKPGKYNFRIQADSIDYNDPNNADVIWRDINVRYGTVNVQINRLDYGLYEISGRNTDSQKTYLWLTGEGLPDCGGDLTHGYNEAQSGVPTVIGNTGLTGITPDVPQNCGLPDCGEYKNTGDFKFQWRIPPTLKPGTYTLWASSVNPSDLSEILRQQKNENWAETKGVCGLLQCDICAPHAKAEFTVDEWDMDDPTLDKDTISLDCCNDSMCTTCPDYPRVILKGDLNLKGIPRGYPLQIWIFGNDKVGDRPLIFTDQFRTFPDDQSSYEIDITRLLLDNGISVCDLENGEYYIVVQAKGVENGLVHPVFDITHERTFAFMGKPVFDETHWYVASSHPYSKFPIGFNSYISTDIYWQADVSANPGYYPLFPIEGNDALPGVKALNALKSALNQDFIHDHYRVVSFTVDNQLCREYVDFTADPVNGKSPLKVSFKDTSKYIGTGFNWDFGDGSTSTLQNPEHTYTKTGLYDVSLDITSGTDKKSRNKLEYINVTTAINADLEAIFRADITKGKVPLTVQFYDLSAGNPVEWKWNFGEGSTSTLQNPVHHYLLTGTYDVSLEVTDSAHTKNKITNTGFIQVT